MYHVRVQGTKTPIFTSSQALRCEMVAIALTLSSFYSSPKAHEVVYKNTVRTTVTPELAFAMMQTKLRNLIYNRKILPKMVYVPDRFTGLAKSRIIRAVRTGEDLDGVKRRLYDEVETYATTAERTLKETE